MFEAIFMASLVLAFTSAVAVFHIAVNRDKAGIGVLVIAVVVALAVFFAGYAIAWHVDPPRATAVGPMSKGTETR